MVLQKTGFDTKSLLPDISLGLVAGIDGSLWAYAFATILFSGAFTVFLPAGILVILCGSALLALTITLSSKLRVHLASLDEQAIVIIGSTGLLLSAHLGEEAASSRGLATMLAIMSMSSLSVAMCFWLAARFRVSQLLELLPYPVICGFMAGIGWLLLDAGISVTIDGSLSRELPRLIQQDHNWMKLMLPVIGGVLLFIILNRFSKAWALPAASTGIFLIFYLVSTLMGWDHQMLTNDGWLFDVPMNQGGSLNMLLQLGYKDIDFGFIASIFPQLLTIVFLTMLSASMNLTALIATHATAQLNSTSEMKGLGRANFLTALVCSPPGLSDAVASDLYSRFGAASRWMQITSVLVILLVAFAGSSLITYMPRLLVGATIFLFAFKLLYNWMYTNVRSFSQLDYLIVCIILFTVIFFGFMLGILVGIVLTVFLFVMRYSMISSIQKNYTLRDHRSTVERSAVSNQILNNYGDQSLIYSLQGYLFFGTANTIREEVFKDINSRRYHTILLDFRRVTGIDISALNVFSQIKQVCDMEDIILCYSNVTTVIHKGLLELEAVSKVGDQLMIFSETDYALEKLEELILKKYADPSTSGDLHKYLSNILCSANKASLLENVMVEKTIKAGDILFSQGDNDKGFYLLHTGAVTAVFQTANSRPQRVKKFSPGSIIGEMSSYTDQQLRTATVTADESSVLYFLDIDTLQEKSEATQAALTAVHELVARTMGVRIEYMNRRLMLELE